MRARDAAHRRHRVPVHQPVTFSAQPLKGVSRISRVTVFLPSFSPASDASVRSAATVRPIPSDHLAGIALRDASQLDERRARVLGLDDVDIGGLVGQRLRQHLDDGLDAHEAFGASATTGTGVR